MTFQDLADFLAFSLLLLILSFFMLFYNDFSVACMRPNLRYGKHQKRKGVKSHHCTIGFDPLHNSDNRLTMDQAQELGERFCREQFPGHLAIICAHPDGHNQFGNIHVHIVINCLWIEMCRCFPI